MAVAVIRFCKLTPMLTELVRGEGWRVMMGTAFGKVVSSLVEKVFLPAVGAITKEFSADDIAKMKSVIPLLNGNKIEIVYGAFISAVIEFIIVAFCLFLVVKGMNAAKKRLEINPKAPEAPADVKLLTEIRDLLKQQKA